jgi:hypothetical protein
MPKVKDMIRQRLLRDAPERLPDLTTLRRTERNPEFEKLRLNRMIMGAFRYGRLGASDKPQWNRVADMIRRLQAYQQDGNAEHLVDVANLAQLEFTEGEHKGVFATDDKQHVSAKE